MKYMTFNSSCSYCCLANLLEAYGIQKEDREIVLEMGLPYLFSYDEAESAYQAGAMLQGKHWFDRYLGTIGFRFCEELIPQAETVPYMQNHVPCMTGLKTEFGKHAMIYVGQQDGNYRFLNPHRAEDGQPDEMLFTDNQLIEVLSEVNAVGYLERTGETISTGNADYENSLICLRRYQADLHQFCAEFRTKEEIMAVVNTLFRPFAVDGLAMMELAGETALAEELRQFQKECMTLFRAGDCCPNKIVDLNRLGRIVEAYEVLIQKKLNQ